MLVLVPDVPLLVGNPPYVDHALAPFRSVEAAQPGLLRAFTDPTSVDHERYFRHGFLHRQIDLRSSARPYVLICWLLLPLPLGRTHMRSTLNPKRAAMSDSSRSTGISMPPYLTLSFTMATRPPGRSTLNIS